MTPDRLRAWYASLKIVPNIPPPVVLFATEASARAMVEACGLSFGTLRPYDATEPPEYPLSGWDVRR